MVQAMMVPGIWQLVIILAVVILLFGAGRISGVMGDVAKGLKNFKKGMAEDDAADKAIENKTSPTMATEKAKDANTAS